MVVMSQNIKVAVSGAGGGAGQSILKALHDTDYKVIALDGEPLGAGLYTTATSYLIPYANSPDFIEKIINICKAENIQFYFPGLDAELPILAKNARRFRDAGITPVVSSPEVVELSDNKLLTHQILTKHGINTPKTYDMKAIDPSDIPLNYPFILKEREGGARSRNLHLIKNAQDLAALTTQAVDMTQFVAQEYIEGDEYTCGSVNFDGECMGVIVMRRILRDGDTYKCFSIKDTMIEEEVRKITSAIKPFGACNIQLRVKDGKPYVFEINARSSGTTAARALCGFNEPKMILDYLVHGKRPEYTIVEQTILRYWKELVVPNELVKEIRENGKLVRSEDYSSL